MYLREKSIESDLEVNMMLEFKRQGFKSAFVILKGFTSVLSEKEIQGEKLVWDESKSQQRSGKFNQK